MNLLSFASSYFFFSLRKITWLNSQDFLLRTQNEAPKDLLNTYPPHLVHMIFEQPVTSNKDSRLEKYLSQRHFLTLILLWQAARCSCQYFSKTGSLSALILSDMRRRRSKWEEELTSNLKFLPFQALNLEILVVYNFYYNSLKHVILVFNFMLIFQGSHLKPFKPNVLSFHLLNQTGILPEKSEIQVW